MLSYENMATECTDCGKAHPARTLITSPFQPMIDSETVASPFETNAIRDFTRHIENEIVRKEHAIDRLLCEVAQLRRSYEQHKFVIAPIRRVPVEILAETFLHLAGIEAETGASSSYYKQDGPQFQKEYMVRPAPRRAPLIFASVSREWRSISLSVPRLWNSISIACRSHDAVRASTSLCDLWLKRAGSLPLSIRIYRDRELPGPDLKTALRIQDLIETILPYANRWRVLDFDNIPSRFFDVVDGVMAPLLESVCVTHGTGASNSLSTPWARLRKTPKLTHLCFDTVLPTHITSGSGVFIWLQLTHINVGCCSAQDFLQILALAPAATACRFVVTKDSAQFDLRPLSHSALQLLK
ncbi:hypothetical protein C8R46DRAFT_456688 [Mycena filopes]|nr:hypothetical protein C8R46DRAFT_456688 [Mycena filopes]